jgi:hypothetical protein
MQQDYSLSSEPEEEEEKSGRGTNLRPETSMKCMEFIQGMSNAH